MTEELYDPGDDGFRVWVSTDRNGRGSDAPTMFVGSPEADALSAAVREAAHKQAEYALHVALLKWQALPQGLPGLVDRGKVEGVLTMVQNAAEALEVFAQIAPEIYGDDEDEAAPEPAPGPAGGASA